MPLSSRSPADAVDSWENMTNPFEDADQCGLTTDAAEETLPVLSSAAAAELTPPPVDEPHSHSMSVEENPFDAPATESYLSPHQLSDEESRASDQPMHGWRAELRVLMQLSVPAVLQNLLFVSMGTGSQMLVGHISSDALAAAVCANLVFNVFFYFLFGFAGALDTLAAQSIGAGSLHGARLWTKRAALILLILTLPAAVPIFFSHGIMTQILGQSSDIADAAQTYCRWLCFGLLPFNLTVVLQKYLQGRGIMKPTIYISAASNLVNLLLEYLLIWPADLGLQGGAIGMSLARYFQFFCTLYYVVVDARDEERDQLTQVAREVDSDLQLAGEGDEADHAAAHDADATRQCESTEMTVSADHLEHDESALPQGRLSSLHSSTSRLLQHGVHRLRSGVSESASAIRSGALASVRTLAAGARSAASYARDPRSLVRDFSTLRQESMQGVWHPPAILQFLLLGLSSGVMTALEAWAFELTGIFAASLSQDELNAHYVMINLTLITYFTFPYGVAIAASIRIGHLIGSGDIATAKITSKIVAAIGASFMTLSGIMLSSLHSVIGYLFSSDAAVVAQVSRIAPIAGVFQLFDGIQGSVGGVLRGLGLQRAAATSNLVGLWVVGVTCAYLFAFPAGLGLPGIWWALAIGLFMTAIGNSLALARTSWPKQVAEAQERLRLDEVEREMRRRAQERPDEPTDTTTGGDDQEEDRDIHIGAQAITHAHPEESSLVHDL